MRTLLCGSAYKHIYDSTVQYCTKRVSSRLTDLGRIVQHFVDSRVRADQLGTRCELQGTPRLLDIGIGRGDAAHHGHFCIPAERGLQQAGQLAVSESDMLPWLLLGQRVNHATQGQQRLVDLAAFLGALAGGTRVTHALRAGKIDEIQRGDQNCTVGFVSSSWALLALDHQFEDGVRATGSVIHVCGLHGALGDALPEGFDN